MKISHHSVKYKLLLSLGNAQHLHLHSNLKQLGRLLNHLSSAISDLHLKLAAFRTALKKSNYLHLRYYLLQRCFKNNSKKYSSNLQEHRKKIRELQNQRNSLFLTFLREIRRVKIVSMKISKKRNIRVKRLVSFRILQ